MAIPGNALSVGVDLQQYTVVEVLGAGSFGVTYRAVHRTSGQQVAIKEYLPKDIAARYGSADVQLIAAEHDRFYQWGMDRFVTEAQILAQFNHPNIVKVVGYFHANRTAYFVMAYQPGDSLATMLRQRASAPGQEVMERWFVPILRGLAAVHQKNYLHRDIKPGNILLSADGNPVLIDFGAACYAMGDEVRKTSDILTPAYASIEQYGADQSLGPWSDLYSLGATMYRCLAGKPPVAATRRANAILSAEPDPLPSARSLGAGSYAEAFLDVIDWMLRLRSIDRPQSAEEVLTRLGERTAGTTDAVETPGRVITGLEDTHTVETRIPAEHYRLVLAGSPGAGKTAAVRSLSDVEVIGVGASAAGPDGTGNPVISYGWVDISADQRLHLYAVSGLEALRHLVGTCCAEADAVILLVDNLDEQRYRQVADFVMRHAELFADNRVGIGITRLNEQPLPGIDAYQTFMLSIEECPGSCPPIMAIDPESVRDLQTLLQAIFLAASFGSANPARPKSRGAE